MKIGVRLAAINTPTNPTSPGGVDFFTPTYPNLPQRIANTKNYNTLKQL